jgi:hypothetical protein
VITMGSAAMADDSDTVHPIDQAIYDSHSPRVAACGTRHGHGDACTVLWIKAGDYGWVLLPHGVPDLAVRLPPHEFITMLDGLRDTL